jgi:lipopolysaccharide export system protein LptC
MLDSVQKPAYGAGLAKSQAAYNRGIRHSRRVRWLKVLLPLAAILVSGAFIAVAVVRSYLPDNIKIAAATIENGMVVMEKPAISGRNRMGILYSMTAARALQPIKDSNTIKLEDINASMPMNADTMADVVAKSATYDRKADDLTVEEPFTITLSNGVTARFQSGFLDVNGGHLVTDKPVSITANGASIDADSLDMSDNGRVIKFTGHVRMNVSPDALRKTQK